MEGCIHCVVKSEDLMDMLRNQDKIKLLFVEAIIMNYVKSQFFGSKDDSRKNIGSSNRCT